VQPIWLLRGAEESLLLIGSRGGYLRVLEALSLYSRKDVDVWTDGAGRAEGHVQLNALQMRGRRSSLGQLGQRPGESRKP
jgi:hypothetical protein